MEAPFAPVPPDVAEWAAANGADLTDAPGVMVVAARQGQMSVLRWLGRNGIMLHGRFPAVVHEVLARASRAEVFDWLRDQGTSFGVMQLDMGHGGYLFRRHVSYRIDSKEALAFAARNGYIRMLSWLHDRQPALLSSLTSAELDAALRAPMLWELTDVLEWFARRLALGEFEKRKLRHVWLRARYGGMLALVLASRRRKMRAPPPEIWRLIADECGFA